MAAVTAYPSVAQFTGVAKEVTPGTAVPMTATLLTDAFTWKDTPTWLDDKAYRGVMGNDSFNVIEGVYYCDISCGGPVYVDTIGYALGNLLGDITTTGSSAPFTHVISLLNPTSGAPTGQPTTHTLTQYYGPTATSGARTFASTCFSQIVFEFNAATGLLTWTGKANSWASQAAVARPTASPSTVVPQAAWQGVMGLGGTASGAPITSLKTAKITVTRELENEFTVNGTQNPLVIFRGPLSVTFDATFIAQNETVYTDMITNAQPQLQFKFASGAGASAINFQVDLQKAAFTSAFPDFSAKTVNWTVSGKGVFNSTNVGTSGGLAPAQFTLQNAVTSGTYV
jgi:hypothetical protein